jgi:Fur family transcriptional regulator, ferric uptake regulator
MTNEIRKAGLKVTLPRVKIMALLEKAKDRHMSAEAIYHELVKSGEEVGIATVYRVLTQFEEAGIVIRHNFEHDHAVFELNQDEHHDHIVCVQCGRVEEFVDEAIEARQKEIAKRYHYEMTDHVLHIYGVCKDCQN